MDISRIKKIKFLDFYIATACSLAVAVLMYYFLGFSYSGISAPYSYDGSDAFLWYLNTKTIGENGWFWTNSRIAAPFEFNAFDFAASYLCNIDTFISGALYLVTKNLIVSYNLFIVLTASLCTFVSFFAFRNFNLNRIFSSLGSILYGTTPYITCRAGGHINLATAFFVPLSILLCAWCYEYKDDFLKINKSFFKKRENYLAVIFALLISNNGLGYYAFFTCFFLCVVALIVLIEERSFRKILSEIKFCVLIVIFSAINLIPVLSYQMKAGNNLGITARGVGEGEYYGLKIAQLFIPNNSVHRIKGLAEIIHTYNTQMPLINENKSAYLGIAGAIGFILSVYFILRGRKKEDNSYALLFSKLTLVGVLFATVGGFSGILSIFFHFIRAYNRISIFIAFFCIYLLLVSVQSLTSREYKNSKVKLAVTIVSIVLLCLCVFEQLPDRNSSIERLALNHKSYVADKEFIESIEATLNEGDMVYELPYHVYPEGGPVNNMSDYSLFTGYIHSNTLKWSYGASHGRDGDIWNAYVSSLDTEDMIHTIIPTGFKGIYIDARAYTPNELAKLTREITSTLGYEPITSDNGNLIFYNLYPYIETDYVDLGLGTIDVEVLKENIAYPELVLDEELTTTVSDDDGLIYFESGMSPAESDFTWTASDEIHMTFTVDSSVETILCTINVLGTFNDMEEEYTIIANGNEILSSSITQGGSIEFSMPNDSDTRNDVYILLPDSTTPFDLFGTNDFRELGIAIGSIEFSSAS